MSVRDDIRAQFQTDWADNPNLDGVRVVVAERELGDIREPVALIRQKSIGKESSAPLSHRRVGMLLTIISPRDDADAAADELDTLVFAALDYLDPKYLHDDAEAVGYNNRFAYDIPFTVIASKE